MEPDGVVERCNEIEHRRARLGARCEVAVVIHLGLEGLEEGLDDGVVETVSGTRCGCQEPVLVERLLHLEGEVLAAAIGVEYQPGLGLRSAIAICSASMTSSWVGRDRIDQPTTRLE